MPPQRNGAARDEDNIWNWHQVIRIGNDVLLHSPRLIGASVGLIHAPVIATSGAVVTVAADAVDPSKPDPLAEQSIFNIWTQLNYLAHAFVAGNFIVMRVVARVDVNVRVAEVQSEDN